MKGITKGAKRLQQGRSRSSSTEGNPIIVEETLQSANKCTKKKAWKEITRDRKKRVSLEEGRKSKRRKKQERFALKGTILGGPTIEKREETESV